MKTTGYECRKCGYAPTQEELNKGSCPQCVEDRIADLRAKKKAQETAQETTQPDTEKK